MTKIVKALLCISMLVFVVISASYAIAVFKTTGKINKHVYIANVNVTGLTKQKVYALLTHLLEQKQSTNIIFKADGYEKAVKLNGTVEDTNMISQIDRAYGHGRSGNIFDNLYYWFGIRKKTINLKLDITYNELQLDSVLESVKNDFINENKSDIIKRISITTSNQEDQSDEITIDLELMKEKIKKYLCNETNNNEIEIIIIGR